MTSEEAIAEYRDEATNWELAPNAHWPETPDMPATNEDGTGNMYQRGYGRGAATHDWACTWQWYLVEAEDDDQRVAAIEQLNLIPTSYFYTDAMEDNGRESTDADLAAMNAGDLSRIARDAELNCRHDSYLYG